MINDFLTRWYVHIKKAYWHHWRDIKIKIKKYNIIWIPNKQNSYAELKKLNKTLKLLAVLNSLHFFFFSNFFLSSQDKPMIQTLHQSNHPNNHNHRYPFPRRQNLFFFHLPFLPLSSFFFRQKLFFFHLSFIPFKRVGKREKGRKGFCVAQKLLILTITVVIFASIVVEILINFCFASLKMMLIM